jgi:adenine phosphoribosyltransferase
MKLIPDEELEALLKPHIRDIPDFPKPGILFKDITTLLKNPTILAMALEQMALRFENQGIVHVVGMESRGFIFGTPLAYLLKTSFVPVRKPGKLPGPTFSKVYELEYGTDTLEIHKDAIKPGEKVLICDDLLATGGTAAATLELLQDLGADVIGALFAIELTFLKGREKLPNCKTVSLIKY